MPMDAKRREYSAAYTKRQHAKYWATHDSTPVCACGCGKNVNLNPNGAPYKYAGKNHHSKITCSTAMQKGWMTRRFRSGAVSMEEFRYAAYAIKYHHAWTWTEMADAFGVPENRLRSMLHDKRLKSVSRERVVGFFESLTEKEVPEAINPCRWIFFELGLKWDPRLRSGSRR